MPGRGSGSGVIDFEVNESEVRTPAEQVLETPDVTRPIDDTPRDRSDFCQSARFPHHGTRVVGHSGPSLKRGLTEVNKELWLVLSMVALAATLNYLATGHRMILGFYTFPTLFSAYFYGRKHATLTAFASFFLVGLLAKVNPGVLAAGREVNLPVGRWYDIVAWGGVLVITAYAMGTLHEHNRARIQELRHTYRGLLLILRHFISKDKHTETHSYRVSVYASKIAAYMGLGEDRIEDVRAASLIHDIGKLKTSRQLLYMAARLAQEDHEEMKKHVGKGAALLEPFGGPLHRIIPIILAYHNKFNGTGHRSKAGHDTPLEARIVAVAHRYDSLTSDKPYRRAISPFDAKEAIFKGSGEEFDPDVVQAFIQAFRENEMEVPELHDRATGDWDDRRLHT